MNPELLCTNCFAELPEKSLFCPFCGFNELEYEKSAYQLPPRTILAGKYMLGRTLGEGGFGITYVGIDLNLEIKVAVKEYFPSGFVTRTSTVSTTVQPHNTDQSEIFAKGKKRFVDEAKRLARFRTLPGIVSVNDYFVENGTAYIVMEFVEGQTLKEYLAAHGGKLPVENVLSMLSPMFDSLAKVHETGMIHRDISPDNIMLTPDGSVKLLDFGAAREFGDENNKSLSVMLKPGYAPIEQYSTKGEQGPWTDVYALSATIYRAITGVTPESSTDRVIGDSLAPPSSHGIDIAPHIDAALMSGLALRSEDRIQTVPELQAALTGNVGATLRGRPQTPAQAHKPKPVGAVGNRPQLPKTKKRKPAVIAAVITACVVIAAVIIIALSGVLSGGDSEAPIGELAVAETAPAGTPSPEPTPTATPEPTPTPTPEPTPRDSENPEDSPNGSRSETIPTPTPPPVIREITREVSNVYASSELNPQTDNAGIRRYWYATNLIDGSDDTIWCEGADDVGIGEWVCFEFAEVFNITGIEIKNGYWIAEDAYINNGYITKLAVEFDWAAGDIEVFDLPLHGAYNQRRAQMIEFSQPYAVTRFYLIIQDAVGGIKWTDTCVTEVRIFGYKE